MQYVRLMSLYIPNQTNAENQCYLLHYRTCEIHPSKKNFLF